VKYLQFRKPAAQAAGPYAYQLRVCLLLLLSRSALSDGVSTWESIGPRAQDGGPASRANLEHILAAGKRSIWVTSGTGASWMTEDGGRTWKYVELVSKRTEVGGLLFLDDRAGWLFGAMGGKAIVASTFDAGKNWEFKHSVVEFHTSVLSDMQFFSKKAGIAVGGGEFDAGPRSLIAVTSDGGATWKNTLLKTDDPQPVLRRVLYQSKSLIWASGGKSIYLSKDGGASWQLRYRDTDAVDLTSLAIVDGTGIFAVGGWGLVLRSRDSGGTWEKVKLPPTVTKQYLSAITFSDASHGWICGDHGTILSTKDGGDTWQEEPTGRSELLRSVAVLGNQVFAVGDGLTVIRRPI
jgi:photosystem II stability/assembly factor-like uncharacterized protein